MLIPLFYDLDPLIPGVGTTILMATALPYAAARKKIWSLRFLNATWGFGLMIWVLLFAVATWYVVAFVALRWNDIEEAQALPLNNLLGVTLVAVASIGLVVYAIDRHLLFVARARNLADLNARFQQQTVGGKEEILHLCEKHTKQARRSVLFFCHSMSFLERDSKYLASIKSLELRAIAKAPSTERDTAFRNLAGSLGIAVRSFNLDPDLRGRLIDRETPERTRLILVKKDVDAAGELVYSARVYTRKDGALIIDMASALFDSLWGPA